MKKSVSALFVSLTLVFWTVSYAQAGVIDPDLQAGLNPLNPEDEVAVIVTLTDQVDLKKIKDKDKNKLRYKVITELKGKADNTQKSLKKFLTDKKAKKIVSFWVFNGLAATVRADVIDSLARQPEVARISLDDTLTRPEPAPASSAQPEWNLTAIGAPDLWALGYTGVGVVVAGVDTGVDSAHPDLAAQWRGGANSWYDPNGEHTTPYDAEGHGTRTMGIMVGGNNSGTAIGVAPGARWIAVKIFDDAGSASFSDIHLGYQWLLDPDKDPNTNDAPDVVNNSWGLRNNVNACIPEFQPDIQALKASQIAVVFAAGNEGPSSYTSISPANYPESMAVGSVDATFAVDYTSSRGPSACDGSIYPQVVAPGVNIKTSDLTLGGVFPNSYISVSGTSFSAPHVAGAMALLLSADPQATVADLELALAQSALDLGLNGPNNDYGNGLVDVAEAYLYLSQTQPTVCMDTDNDGFYTTVDCGQPVDCNDTDPAVYPGAVEVKHDGIDQDCNGYDLTITITKAAYTAKRDTLSVEATSVLGSAAALELVGFGPMKWNRKKQNWTISINGAGGNPGAVTVQGVEGAEIANVR